MIKPTAWCLLLLLASSIVHARDVRMHGANGDGGACPDAAPVTLITPVAIHHPPTSASHGKAKVPSMFRGSDEDGGSHTPRWHSFLPGMFR